MTEFTQVSQTGHATEADAVAQIAIDSVTGPEEIDPSKHYATVLHGNQRVEILDLEHHLPNPRRKTGDVELHDGESFSAYVVKHREEPDRTTLYADVTRQTIVGVLDDAGTDGPGWRQHIARLQLRHTDAWTRWMKLNNVLGSQTAFAEHIEDSLPDIVDPDGATMLEIAQSFQAHTNVRFESSRLLHSGQRQITYREETNATAGEVGTLEVPKEMTLGIAPFEVGEPYKITARIRFRLADGRLTIGYKLDRPEDVLAEAFTDVVEEVQNRTGMHVLYGLPPTS